MRERNRIKPWEDYGKWMYYQGADPTDSYVYQYNETNHHAWCAYVFDTKEEAIEGLKDVIKKEVEEILKFDWLKKLRYKNVVELE